MLARRIATAGLRSNLPAAVRGFVTYNPSKKPFEYNVEKDGEKVPLDLEGPEAPHWNDNNEEFWKKAEEFCADQPEVPIPYGVMLKVAAYSAGFFALWKILLEKGSAGRAWCDPYINSDEQLMFGMLRDSAIGPEERIIIDNYREIARRLSLLARLVEMWKLSPLDKELKKSTANRQYTRFLMGHREDMMRKRTPQQDAEGKASAHMTLMAKLESLRLSNKPDEVYVAQRDF